MALIPITLVPLLFTLTLVGININSSEADPLSFGFYANRCPNAEEIVAKTVRDAALSSARIAPMLLRLHFHDCFVQGCDGSILIEIGPESENKAFGHQGLGGLDVIEKAKTQLESQCPGVVSCADIVALAARDAIAVANGPRYEVPTGRRDGLTVNISSASIMPEVSESIASLKSKFLSKGLSEKDLVVLSAAHTIGTTACFFMNDRLYNFNPSNPSGGSDPAIDPNFLPELKAKCPPRSNMERIDMDNGSGQTFDNHILQNIRSGSAVLWSDAKLYEDVETRAIVDSYFGILAPLFGPTFENDFVESMVKMGQIDVLTGSEGEIRSVCSAFNK